MFRTRLSSARASARILAAAVSLLPYVAAAAGDFPVGFRVIEKRDLSRAAKEFPAGRPIQIALWYPAKAGASSGPTRMRYRDYMILGLSEKTFEAPTSEAIQRLLAGYGKFVESTGVEAAEAAAILETPMRASRGAPAAAGSFPLVLLAPGNGQSADDMADLGERLAAAGFVAASVPSATRISGPMQSEKDIPGKADEQAADLAFARRAVGDAARPGSAGVVGHSFGARSALLLAMREPAIAAVVSLDGGIGAKTGKGMLEKAPGFSRERMQTPLLHFYEELDPQMTPDFDLIRSLDRSDRWLVRVASIHHIHFTTIGALIAGAPGLSRATSATPATGPARKAVVDAAVSFLAFFGGASAPATPWQPPDDAALRVEKLPARR
jgi:dienelactone hydrolase